MVGRMTLQRYSALISGTCEYVRCLNSMARGILMKVLGLRIVRVFWIHQIGLSQSQNPWRRELPAAAGRRDAEGIWEDLQCEEDLMVPFVL
jgi:hypothetical protein